MRRTQIILLVALAAAIPAATAGSFFSPSSKPCFIAGSSGYLISTDTSANYTVRVDSAAPHPGLRMQLVDTPANADFVLVDDGEAANACTGAASIKSIRVDDQARKPDMTVALSRQPADYKIYVRSAHYSVEDGAALFAAMWQDARQGDPNLRVANRTE